MLAIIEKVTRKIRQREEKAVGSYRETVRNVSAGKDPSADDVLATLTAAGRTPADLARDVERLNARKAARAALDKLPAAAAEQAKVDAALRVAAEALEAAESTYQRTVGPLYERRQQLDSTIAAGEAGRTLLTDVERCPYAELAASLTEARDALTTAANRRAAIVRLKQGAEPQFDQVCRTLWRAMDHAGSPAEPADMRGAFDVSALDGNRIAGGRSIVLVESAKALHRELTAADEELAELDKAIPALEARVAELEAETLNP